jgi:hypothetical protein
VEVFPKVPVIPMSRSERVVPVEGGGEERSRRPRVGHHDGGKPLDRRGGAGGHGPGRAGVGDEPGPVGPGAPLDHEEIAGADLAGIHRDAADGARFLAAQQHSQRDPRASSAMRVPSAMAGLSGLRLVSAD